jgi:hypothetical protein
MREPRAYSPWTIDLSEADDEELARALLDFVDEVSRVHTLLGEMILGLDHVTAVAVERWSPAAFAEIEKQERDLTLAWRR